MIACELAKRWWIPNQLPAVSSSSSKSRPTLHTHYTSPQRAWKWK